MAVLKVAIYGSPARSAAAWDAWCGSPPPSDIRSVGADTSYEDHWVEAFEVDAVSRAAAAARLIAWLDELPEVEKCRVIA